MAEPARSSLSVRAVEAFRWSALAAAGDALLALGILAVLARLLAPRDFGVVATAMIFIGVIGTAGKLGIGPALVQRAGLTARHVATGFVLSAGLGALSTAALWLAAPATARFFGDAQVVPVLGALSAVFVINGLGETSEHLLSRQLRFGALMFAGLASQAVGYGLVTVAMALGGYGAWSLVAGLLARHALFSAIVVAMRPPPVLCAPGRQEARDLLRFGTGFSLSSLLAAIAGQGSRFVIASGLGAAALGHYTQACRVAGTPGRLGRVLQRVLFPTMSQRQHRIDHLRDVYLHGAEMTSLLAVPVCVLMAQCAPEIVAVLFGPQWDAAAPVLEVLAVGAALHATNVVNIPAIRALGAVYREAWRRALFVALALFGVWVGIGWGLVGAAAAVAAARIVLCLLLTHLTLSLLGLRWGRLLRCHVPALWAGAWSAGALLATTGIAREAALGDAATLAASIGAWGAACVGAVRYAPGFARAQSLPWALMHIPFAQIGASGRLARSVLALLDGKPACRSTTRAPDPAGPMGTGVGDAPAFDPVPGRARGRAQ